MTVKRCVFIESNTTGTGEVLLNNALHAGYDVWFLTANPTKYRFLDAALVHTVEIDTQQEHLMYNLLAELGNIECIMSTSEYFIHGCARLCEKFGLPSNSPEAIAICRDKHVLATTLAQHKIATPHSMTFNTAELLAALSPTNAETANSAFSNSACSNHDDREDLDDKNTLTQIPFPCVLKPVSSSGSIGVQRIQNIHELTTYVQQTKEPSLLCQTFIDGSEFSVESFSFNGAHSIIGITQKHLGEWPYFVETGHNFPAELTTTLRDHIESCVQHTLAAVGFRFGPAHIELRIREGKAWIIEVNPRLAGGMIPELIKQSCGDDPLTLLFDLYRGKSASWLDKNNAIRFGQPQQHTAIRFCIAEKTGQIAQLHVEKHHLRVKKSEQNTQKPANADSPLNTQSRITLIKQVGDSIAQLGDFSARVAHVITCANSSTQATQAAEQLLATIALTITPCVSAATSKTTNAATLAERINARLNHTGRLASALDSRAQALLSNSTSLIESDIAYITKIDEAHVLMLHQQGLLATPAAQQLLRAIDTLQQERFQPLNALAHPRGIYLSYEAYLCEQLGDAIGGQLQLGRSRNDLNATINALQLRDFTQQISQQCWRLSSVLLQKAYQHQHTLLPLYSQYQTALPGTFGFYLAGVASNMLDTLSQLHHLANTQSRCPLGAGAGGGTGLAINPQCTANYLGFTSAERNALTAVSSRANNLRVLGEIQNGLLLMSRVAQDWQFMSSREVALVALPDRLCGGSSSMPQKKNPYLLEWVKAMVTEISADYQALTATLSKTPFSNSYEVSSVCARKTDSLCHRAYRVLGMMTLLIEGTEIHQARSQQLIEQEYTWATYVAEQLATDKAQDFRTAHHNVGERIAQQTAERASSSIHTPSSIHSSAQVFAQLTDENQIFSAKQIVENIRYGGGPASASVKPQLDAVSAELHHIRGQLNANETHYQQHESLRKQAVQQLLAENDDRVFYTQNTKK